MIKTKEMLTLMETEEVKKIAKEIAEKKGLDTENISFEKTYGRWIEAIKSLTDKEISVMVMRKNKETLETVGRKFGVTRERIRQIETKTEEKIKLALSKQRD